MGRSRSSTYFLTKRGWHKRKYKKINQFYTKHLNITHRNSGVEKGRYFVSSLDLISHNRFAYNTDIFNNSARLLLFFFFPHQGYNGEGTRPTWNVWLRYVIIGLQRATKHVFPLLGWEVILIIAKLSNHTGFGIVIL